jgi:hypothetical protein
VSGLLIDRETYSRQCEALDTYELMVESVPFEYHSEHVSIDRYYVTRRDWVEWKSMEERDKWLKILGDL